MTTTNKRVALVLGLAAAMNMAAARAQDDSCSLPGVLVIEDPSNDSGVQPGTGDQDYFDIQTLHVAEPATLPGKIVFTLKMRGFSDTPSGVRWVVRFTPPTPPADAEDYFVGMSTVPGEGTADAPGFIWGTTAVEPGDPAPAGARLLTPQGDLAEGSGYAPDGTLTLVLDKSVVGNPQAGQELYPVAPYVRAPVTPQNYLIFDDGGDGFYAIVGDECSDAKSGILGVGALSPFSTALLLLAGLFGFRRRP